MPILQLARHLLTERRMETGNIVLLPWILGEMVQLRLGLGAGNVFPLSRAQCTHRPSVVLEVEQPIARPNELEMRWGHILSIGWPVCSR